MNHFPDCQIFDMPQRSDEWRQARKGVLTASNFGAWLLAEREVRLTIDEIKARLDALGMTYPSKGKKEDYVAILPNADSYKSYAQGAADARENAICRLIAERANCEEAPDYDTWTTKRGTELEPQAVAAFMGETGKKVREVGFCRSKLGAFGCSPDSLLVDENAGLEGKVPIPSSHIMYRRAGVLPSEYEYQVHGCMSVTGADRWYFQSWCPGLAPLRIVVERNEFTERLKNALISFSMEFEKAWAEEREAVAAMRGKQ